MPPLMSNHGNYIASLGLLCRWLAQQAEGLGVEIYPGFAGAGVEIGPSGELTGIITGDLGLGRDGQPKANYTPGMILRGKYSLIAEGARGSLAKQLIAHFRLAEGTPPQTFGLGLKELWELPREKHCPGFVMHTMGWPLDSRTGGGSFIYHYGDGLASVGFVVHLDYANPFLSPFEEFQRFKTHPSIRRMLEGGRRIAYGARAITEGGMQAVPNLVFPGGALIGCAAGFVNVPRIKGSHNAILTGIYAAESAFDALRDGRAGDVLTGYEERWRPRRCTANCGWCEMSNRSGRVGERSPAFHSAQSTCGSINCLGSARLERCAVEDRTTRISSPPTKRVPSNTRSQMASSPSIGFHPCLSREHDMRRTSRFTSN